MAIIYNEEVDCMSLDSMQEIHENEIALLNEIDKLATKLQMGTIEKNELEEKIDQYIDHVKMHFETEEELMEKYDFPSYEMHKMAHDMFLADLQYSTMIWKRHGDIDKVISFIRKSPEWIIMHIKTVDGPTSQYLTSKIQSD
jgi:hemerythrin